MFKEDRDIEINGPVHLSRQTSSLRTATSKLLTSKNVEALDTSKFALNDNDESLDCCESFLIFTNFTAVLECMQLKAFELLSPN
jgi:hypothetical protein